MALGRAWVTAASITTASSFGCSPLLLSLRARAGRRGPRRGVDDLANSTTVYRSWSAPPAALSRNSLPAAGRGILLRPYLDPPGVLGRLAFQRSIQLPTTAGSSVPDPSCLTECSTRAVKARESSPGLSASGLPIRTATGPGRGKARPLGMTRCEPLMCIGTTGLLVWVG